jgi:hypothetical protein
MSAAKKKNGNEIHDDHDYEQGRGAFTRLRRRREALVEDELATPNLDIGYAVAVAQTAEPRVRALLPELTKLYDFDEGIVDELHDAALATVYANAIFAPPESGIASLVAEAKSVRKVLLDQATALAGLGLLEKDRVSAARRGRTRRALANSLLSLGGLILENWKDVERSVTVPRRTVEEAFDLGGRLNRALHPKSNEARTDSPVNGDARIRAYTLLARTYDQIRRAVVYVRWNEGDADDIAPSLYPVRGSRKRKGDATDVVPMSAPPSPPSAGAGAPPNG